MSSSNVSGTSPLSRKFIWAGMALGFGLGGFFDGILLHQVLQWHHLLSGVEDARLDIRTLILTDGLFHILMYIITCCGLYVLWRAKDNVSWLVPDRTMVACAAAGFGIWHVIDSVLSHWILGIHRVRMDVDNPLFWDLLWFAAFGAGPLILAAYWLQSSPTSGTPILSSPPAILFATCMAGSAALLPPPQSDTVMVMFQPGLTAGQALSAIESVDGQILWIDDTQQVWAINLSEPDRADDLYSRGALLVGNSILPTGCFGWSRPG